jgi:integrase
MIAAREGGVAQKPKPFGFGSVRLRVIGGPGDAGEWRWRAERYVGGKAVSVWVGWATVAEAKDPRGRVAAAITASLDGATRRAEVAPADADPLVSEFLQSWQAEIESRGEGVMPEWADSTVSTHLVRSNRLIELVSAARMSGMSTPWAVSLAKRARQKWSPGFAGSVLQELRMALEWGRTVGLRLPTIEVPSIAWEPVREQVTPDDEALTRVYLALVERGGWERAAFRLQWATGCRISEMAYVRRRDVDPATGRVHFPRGKTGPRTMYIDPTVAAEILRLAPEPPPEDRDPLLLLRSAASVRNRLPVVVDEALAVLRAKHEAGEGPPPPERWTSHGLRRHAIRSGRRAGVDVVVMAAAVGNSPKTIWQHYEQASEDDVREAGRVLRLGVIEGVVSLPGGRKP